MIRSNARSWPPHRYLRKFHRRLLDLRQRLARDIEVVDGSAAYRFRCESVREFNRCLKLFSKEPGTAAWIASAVRSGEVFYDIGANIGVYTILAARQVGSKGKVCAFEPHADEILDFLNERQYGLIQKHYTRSAERRLKETGDGTGGCNAIFRRSV